MAQEICLTIEDTGEMFVSVGEKETTEEPGEQKTPVANIDEALAAIKQMAAAVSAPQPDQPQPDQAAQDQAAQEDAMNASFRPGTTGR